MSGKGNGDEGSKSLGSWFPNASVRKTKALGKDDRCSLLLFYHYVNPLMSEGRKAHLQKFLDELTSELGLGGRLRIAREGLNCTISGSRDCVRGFAERLKDWGSTSLKEGQVTPFGNCEQFKFVDDLPPDRAFKDCKVIPVNELVFYGVGEQEAPLTKGGVHLNPKDYHKKMEEDNAVIIDVRNSYEADIGKFVGQEGKGGAEYIDPKMRKSTDFKAWLGKEETKEKLKGKQVLMYCTGGVRCERASALLKTTYGDSHVDGVYQLEGGIEKYMMEFPDGGHWKGKNFVFDKREAFGIKSKEGVGGVVKKKKKKDKEGGEDEEEVLGVCCVCKTSWDRYVGKKKCYTCGVPVLMCDKCMSEKPDKTKGRELEVRCPLCVEENIVTAANDVDFTDNGIGVKAKKEKGGAKAAKSVLKWGGGVAKEKKKKRALMRKVCKFGVACTRENCWFSHPGREEGGDSKRCKTVGE